jgi:excisionase family DNA binding protein
MSDTTQQPEPAWDTKQVARFLGLKKPDAILALVRSKRLPAVRLGRRWRFCPEQVRAFLRGEPAPAAKAVQRHGRGVPEWMRGVERVIRR